MNRPIKFRAWVKSQKRMVPWDGVDGTRNYFREMAVDEDTALMQFTGLHDKNGKEIYEGDILNNIYGVSGEVRWDDWKKQFRVFYAGSSFQMTHASYGYKNGDARCEVIGNIYENPDLLKEGTRTAADAVKES